MGRLTLSPGIMAQTRLHSFALVLLVASALLAAFAPTASASADPCLEDFQDTVFPANPEMSGCYTFGTTGTGSVIVATNPVTNGDNPSTKSLRIGTSMTAQFTWTADQCAGGISFKVMRAGLSGATYIRVTNAAYSDNTFIETAATGALSHGYRVDGADGATVDMGFTAVAANVWRTFSFSCPVTTGTTQVVDYTNSATFNRGTYGSATFNSKVIVEFAAGPGDYYWVDDLNFLGRSQPAASFGSAAVSATYTALTGFDVDPTGTTAIVRYDSGGSSYVATYPAQGLGATATATKDTTCGSMTGRVRSLVTNVMYLDCGGSDFLEIDSSVLGPPNVPPACPSQDDTQWDDLDDGDLDEVSDVSDISDFRILTPRYDAVVQDGSGCSVFGYVILGTNDGRVGLRTINFLALGSGSVTDLGEYSSVPFAATNQPVTKLCGSIFDTADTGTESNVFIVAADTTTSTVIFEAVGAPARLQAYRTLGGGLGSANAVACSAGSKALIASGSGIYNFDIANGTSTQLFAGTVDLEANGLVMSLDGKWGGYIPVSTGSIVLFHASNGTVVGEVPRPSGAFRALRMDSTGQNLWVATATAVNRYEIFTATTGTPVASPDLCPETNTVVIGCVNSGAGSSTGAGGDGDPLGGDRGCLLCEGDDASLFGEGGARAMRGWGFTLLLVVSMAAVLGGLAASSKDAAKIAMLAGGGAALGLVAGLSLSYWLGWLDIGDVLLAVFFVVAALVLTFLIMRR